MWKRIAIVALAALIHADVLFDFIFTVRSKSMDGDFFLMVLRVP